MLLRFTLVLLCLSAQLYLTVSVCNKSNINCYVCISTVQPGCADPFNKKDILLKSCTGCCIKGINNQVTVRACASSTTNDTQEEYERKRADLIKENIWMCDTDECNSL